MATLKTLSQRSLKRHERYRPANILYRGTTIPCVISGRVSSLEYEPGGYHDSESVTFFVRDEFTTELALTADNGTITADTVNFTADGTHVSVDFNPEDQFQHVESGDLFRISSATHDHGGGHWRVIGRHVA